MDFVLDGDWRMGELKTLNNIGNELEKRLNEIEIYSYEDLVNCGSQEVWLRLKKVDEGVCINTLMALEGAIQHIRWHKLSNKDKEHLKKFYENNK